MTIKYPYQIDDLVNIQHVSDVGGFITVKSKSLDGISCNIDGMETFNIKLLIDAITAELQKTIPNKTAKDLVSNVISYNGGVVSSYSVGITSIGSPSNIKVGKLVNNNATFVGLILKTKDFSALGITELVVPYKMYSAIK